MENKLFEFNWKKTAVFLVYTILLAVILVMRVKNGETISFTTEAPDSTSQALEGNYKGVLCKQYFQLEKNSRLDFISIQFATFSGAVNAEGLWFLCYTADGIPVAQAKIKKEDLQDNQYYSINIDSDFINESGYYYFTLEGIDEEASGRITPAIWCTTEGHKGDRLFINGKEQEFTLNAVYKCTKDKYTTFIYLGLQFAIALFLCFICLRNIRNKYLSVGINLAVFLGNFVFIEWITENIGLSGIEISWQIKLMTYVMMLCVQLIIFGLCGNVYLSIIITDIFFVIFSLVNYFVMIYRGVPVIPSDLFAAKTLATVVDTYTIKFTMEQLVMFLWLILWLQLTVRLMCNDHFHLKWKKEKSIIIRKVVSGVLSLAAGAAGIVWLCNPTILEQSGIIPYIWNRNEGYYRNGPFMNFMVNVQYAKISKPEGYTRELAEEYLAAYEKEEDKNSGDNPNIIIIMNESLADFETYVSSDVTFSSDPLPFIHSLTENTVKGQCYVSIFGSGTSNSELEALTGHSMAFFPAGSIVYQQFAKERTLGLANSLKGQGYTCIAIHPCNRGNYNRDSIYSGMGFEVFYAQEDFEDPEIVRWISDKATYEKIIDLYEDKEEDDRLFIFDVTMQGHGGYDTNTSWENPISVNDGDFPLTEEYLSCSYVSDQAFSYLVDYFAGQSEPTIICMFGDHQPSVESEFFELLLGKSLGDLNLEEVQKKYITPYVIWANYDIEGENRTISSNQLGTLVKRTAGVKMNAYDRFIEDFSEVIPVINANGYQDAEGTWYEFGENSPYTKILEMYDFIQYGIYCDGLEVK